MLQMTQRYPEFAELHQNYFALRTLDQLLILWSGQARQKLKRGAHEFIEDFAGQIFGYHCSKNYFEVTQELLQRNCDLLKKIDPWSKSF
jgi:hypothetical protein